jgi:hypothetical protein
MTLPDPFPVARYRLHARVLRAVHWPEYEGSALRGLWGHALRAMACATGQVMCQGCTLAPRCSYSSLFEPAPPAGARSYGDLTPPYVIEPSQAGGSRTLAPGDTYSFDLVLFGRGLAELPLVLRSWRHALAGDIGPSRGAMRLERVEWLEGAEGPLDVAEMTPQGLSEVARHRPAVALPSSTLVPRRAWVEWSTPVFVKRGGRPLEPGTFGASDFAWAVVRRVAEVCELHLGEPTGMDFKSLKLAAAQLRFISPRFQHCAFSRWSNRQQQAMRLEGIVGGALIDGPLEPFWPLLHLGQWLHAGGKTSFGLGRYHLRPVAPASAMQAFLEDQT